VIENNKRLVRRLVEEIWNQGNLDVIDEIVTSDYVRHDPGWPEEISGREGLREKLCSIRRAFGDLEVTVEDLIAESDRVVVRWRMKGTHQADFMGIMPTRLDIALVGMSMHRMDNGQIAETWDGYDSLGLMQQLGVVP
jgi:steroid delta-isomerase-like uncharacterized protein